MSICTAPPVHPNHVHRRLTSRHFRILNRSDFEHDRLCNVFAITFRPGNRTGCFSESLRKLGQGVLIYLGYGRDEQTGRRTMPTRGYRARMGTDGFVTYSAKDLLFHHDAALRPSTHSRGQALNLLRNPSLVELAQRMDRSCQRALERSRWLPCVPMLPRIILSFSPSQPPEFEDSQALRELAAAELGTTVNELGPNGYLLLERHLRNLWDAQLLRPDDVMNSTNCFLISAEYCTQAGKALRAYEDYSALLGAPTWNPARALEPLELPNPARQVLAQFGIESLEQPITDDELAAMVAVVRRAVGPDISLSETEIYDAFAESDELISAWSPRLRELRAELDPTVSETATDDDLLRATLAPEQPLIASLGCKVQVLERRSENDPAALSFSRQALGRRVELDLSSQDFRAVNR